MDDMRTLEEIDQEIFYYLGMYSLSLEDRMNVLLDERHAVFKSSRDLVVAPVGQ